MVHLSPNNQPDRPAWHRSSFPTGSRPEGKIFTYTGKLWGSFNQIDWIKITGHAEAFCRTVQKTVMRITQQEIEPTSQTPSPEPLESRMELRSPQQDQEDDDSGEEKDEEEIPDKQEPEDDEEDDAELSGMEQYADKFAEAIEGAQELMTELVIVESRYRRSIEETPPRSESHLQEAPQNDYRFIVEKSALPLPKLRKFAGDRLQYSSFRTLFREMIDRSGQNNLLKLNHLMESLTGEALHLVSKLSMTGENFEIAMELLEKKYGDSRKIISTLVKNLQNSKAASDKTKDQRELLDTLQINIRQLNDLKEPLDTVIMQDMVIQKFARRIQAIVFKKRISVRLTEDQKVPEESETPSQATTWNLEKILDHLEEIISMEEELEEHMSPKPDHKPENQGKKTGTSEEKPKKSEPNSRGDKNKMRCFACNLENHWTSECPTFPDPKQRTALLVAEDRCTQCARKDHQANQCRRPPCRWCKQPGHLPSNCPVRPSSTRVADTGTNNSSSKKPQEGAKSQHGKPQTVAVVTRKEESDSEFIRTTAFQGSEGFREEIAIIPTVKVKALNPRTQQWQNVSLMLDTGADTSYITAKLQEEWDLPILESKTFAIKTFGDPTPTLKVRQRTSISLLTMRNKVFTVKPYIQPSLVGVIRKNPILSKDIRYAQLLELDVNEQCYEAKVEPDIIIGGDYFTRMTHGNHHTLPSGITLLDTVFGNTMMGVPFDDETIDESPESVHEKYQFSIVQDFEYMSMSERNAEESQRRDMQMKTSGEHTGPLSEEITATEELTWKHFKNTVEKRPEGYFVRLHFKENHPPLPDNYAIAIRRLQSVGRNHSRAVLLMVDKVFQDQIEKGIVEPVIEPRNSKPGIHYNAHQPVLTPTKTTTKCRVVIDGSSHFKGKPSLNDIIHQGPTILPDLVHLILRFRSGSIALVADVEKAFLQVFLHEDDRDYTRVLWVKDIDAPFSGENIIELRFTRVLFGLNISPFLLGATILHHFEQLEDKELANEMRANLYVDNLILTTDKSPKDAISLYRGAKQAFSDMSMNLREFQTNSSELADQIDQVDRANEIEMKIMGIKWDSQLDVLIMGVHIDYLDGNSRRSVSSSIAIQFDPHGLLSPILLPMRLFQRELWEDEFNYNWDTPLVEDHEKRWEELVAAANDFSIQVPREVTQKTKANFIVTFTDASKDATACCTYVVNDLGSHIIFGKSKIKPLKEVFTIPKLETQALKMGTEKTADIIKALQDGKIIVTRVFIFTDSTIALSWLKGQPSQKEVGIFVRNRLASIRAASEKIESLSIPVQFGHVTTDQNPADLGTRGIDRVNFSRTLWWHGPKFLEDDPSQWTHNGLFSISETCSDLVRQVNVLCKDFKKEYEPIFDCSRTYDYGKMKRVVAYSLKFIKKFFNCCSDATKQKLELNIPVLREFTVGNDLSGPEIRISEVTLIRDHQRGSFEQKDFQKWNNLNLNVNALGLIISQGRLGQSELDDNAKFPILIAPNSDLAIQIVWFAHAKLHRSENHTISVVLENFWIPQVRQLVRKLRRTCVPCQRTLKAPFIYPNMGQLPSARVQRARPYENIGLDYFGPMQYRISQDEIGTSFGVIFTCSVSRLTHIEIAPDYSAFIQALRRFISINGIPTSIVSDNAPAHILGEKMINESIIKAIEQMSAEVIAFLGTHAIHWKFNTPYAPWQGGFFERLIRIAKEILVRSIRTTILSYEELRTIFLEVAASMNSRPLTMPSSDNNSGPPLRPMDFVCPGRPMTLPVLDSEILEEYLPSKEAQAEVTKNETIRALENSMKATEEIWRRWQKEYLVQLRAHHKTRMDNKRGTPQHPKVDQIVLLCDELQPRNYCRLAKITKLVESSDKEIREVLVETVTGKNQKHILRRSINQVVPLEMDGSDDEEGKTEVPLKKSNDHKETPMAIQEEPRYNLRSRKKVNYNEADEAQSVVATAGSLGIPPITTLMSLCCLFLLFGTVTGSGASHSQTHAVCTPTGLQIRGYYESFEACVKEYCTSRSRLRWSRMQTADIWIPPNHKTAPHHATVKIFDGHDLSTWELDCAAVHLCDTIDCTFCWTNILNPECHMMYAIIGLGMTSFLSLFCIYAMCCVPVRLVDLAILGWNIIKWAAKGIGLLATKAYNKIIGRTRQRNRWRLSMAVICLSMVTIGNACQDIDFLSALQTRCTETNGNQKCETYTDVVVNLNQVKQDGCIRISKNGTHHWDIRLKLEAVVLSCTKESITTTQDVFTRVWSTKRCDSAGSCQEGKCVNITREALIPELHAANSYTGFTGCSESCGGPGCGCFFLSSGCLFYRVFAVPRTPELYEIYRCMDYSTNAVVTMISTRLQGWQNKEQTQDLVLAIGTSVAFSEAVVTLDTLWTPPSPVLDNWFITNKNKTATWVPNHIPAFTCSERGENCTLQDTCHCNPAENTMICSCKSEDLKDWFNRVDRRLPVHQGHWRMEQRNESIVAQMKHGATASLTIRLRDQWKTVKYITEDTCTVTHSPAVGCYSCENGASAEIFCESENTETFASIQCDRDAFAVKCTKEGYVSNITFFSQYSRFRKTCTVECGGPKQHIEINGMLKYTASIWTTLDRLISGNTTVYNEWNLPDIGHIFDAYLTMMKTIIIMLVAVFAIFFFTYSIIVSTGVKTAKGILKIILMVLLCPITAVVYIYFFCRRRLARNRHKTDHIA